jgi:enoyl-CoA hydratase/carnithine racemase
LSPETIYVGDRVRVGASGSYREVWLTRPAVANAIDTKMRDELLEVLTTFARDYEVTAIGLLGEGKDFCAGGDLTEFGTVSDPLTGWMIRTAHSLPAAFQDACSRMVVGVRGAVVGAGVELASFARYVVATEESRFWLPELAMGLMPGSGGTVSVPRRIGRHRMLEMLVTADWMTATEARHVGLVDELVGFASLVDRVREVAVT